MRFWRRATFRSGLVGGCSALGSTRAAFVVAFGLPGLLAPALQRNAVTAGGGLSAPPKSARCSSAILIASDNKSRNRDSMASFAFARRFSPCNFHRWYSEITPLMGFHRIAFGRRINHAGVTGRIEHSERVPLRGLLAVWFSGARSRPGQLILRRVGRFSGLLAGLDGAGNSCEVMWLIRRTYRPLRCFRVNSFIGKLADTG